MFLGDDLLPWLTLAMGAALAVGTVLAMLRPPDERGATDLDKPPVARSVIMIAIGTIAAVWGLASLISG